MRLLFIKDTEVKELNKTLKTGSEGHFTNNFANEQIKKGNAIKLREGVVVTPALIEHATKKKKK